MKKKSEKKKIFIWGAGGQGRVDSDILKENNNFEICGFIDSNPQLWNKTVNGVKVLGGKNKLGYLKKMGINSGIVAIGNNPIRHKISGYLKEKGFSLINAIHPSVVLSSTAKIGKNVTISAGAIICVDAVIRDNVIINTGAIIEHDNIIGNSAHIASGVQLGGRVIVGERVLVGVGATVLPYKKIGDNSIIGAGAVVIDDIPANVVAVGIPAKIIRKTTNSGADDENDSNRRQLQWL